MTLVADPPKRQLSARQAEVVATLLDATEMEVTAHGYDRLSVRNVARRAGVAPATAYTYFSSKDHMLAELQWRYLRDLPPVDEVPGMDREERLKKTLDGLVAAATHSPALIDAWTVALLATHPEVKHLRRCIGIEIHRRIASVFSPDVDPTVVRVLETTLAGSLLTAGMGHLAFAEIPEFVTGAARLMLAGSP